MATKQFRLKNLYFISNPVLGQQSIYEFLIMRKLHGKESRLRTRFLKAIEPAVTEIGEERLKMAKEFADKNDKGEPILLDKEGNVTTEEKDGVTFQMKERLAEFNKEFAAFLDEEFRVNVDSTNREMFTVIRDILLNTSEEFTGRMATLYDDWCVAFENIKEYPDDEPKQE